MKKSKLLAIIAVMLTLVIGVFTLTACGSTVDYTFEAEDAVLVGTTQGYVNGAQQETGITVEEGTEWAGLNEDGTPKEGPAVKNLGNFNAATQSVTWTITSSKECDATLTLRAASAVWAMAEDFSSFGMAEVDLSKNEYVTLKVNGTAVALEGTLPGLSELGWDMMANGAIYRNFGTGTAKIHLVAGENVIVLNAMGAQGGINVDKIVINCTAELSFQKTNNG